MYGDKAIELLQELKRSKGIPEYRVDLITSIVQEMEELFRIVKAIMVSPQNKQQQHVADPSVACGIVTHHQSLLRNKRCVLAYLFNRMQRIVQLRWDIGPQPPEGIHKNLSEDEWTFFKQYSSILGQYSSDVGLNLTENMTPPKDLYIHCRVLESHGDISTSHGPLLLKKNTQVFVHRSDVEDLIRQGILEHIGDS